MKQETIKAIFESYINGNITETKQAIKKMSKMDFINFAEEMRSNLGNDSIMLYKLKGLLEW